MFSFVSARLCVVTPSARLSSLPRRRRRVFSAATAARVDASHAFFSDDVSYTSANATASPRRSASVKTSMSHSMSLCPESFSFGVTPGSDVAAYCTNPFPVGPKYTCDGRRW